MIGADADPAAAELPAASSSDDEDVEPDVVAFHENRLREQAAQQVAERDELERRYAAQHAELLAD